MKKQTQIKRVYYIALWLLVLWSSGSLLLPAEKWNLGVGYDGFYSNNIFLNADGVNDYVSRFSADFDVPLKQLNLRLSAYSDIYATNSDYNSFNLAPELEYYVPLNKKVGLLLTGGYELLSYNKMYTDFNFSGPQFQAGLKFALGKQMLMKAGYSFQSRHYANFESFDFENHHAFIQCRRSFKSQTTLVLQSGFHYRYYPHIAADYDFGEGYHYYFNFGSHGSGHGMGGNGAGHSNPMPPNPNPTSGAFNTLGIPDFYATLGIQQSLSPRFSITAETEIRHNFQELDFTTAQTLIKNAYLIYPMNDDFLWAGYRFSLKLNMVLLAGISMESDVSHYHKKYRGIFVLDEQGNIAAPETLRQDKVTLFNLEMWKETGQFRLFTALSYRLNHSSDGYFDYSLFTLSAGLSYQF